jgi:hypothetical protein
MHLSDHSLNQLDEAYVQTLDAGVLRGLSLRLLEDLKKRVNGCGRIRTIVLVHPSVVHPGRTQVCKAKETLIHRPSASVACAEALPGETRPVSPTPASSRSIWCRAIPRNRAFTCGAKSRKKSKIFNIKSKSIQFFKLLT